MCGSLPQEDIAGEKSEAPVSPISIVVDGEIGKSVQFGLESLQKALELKGVSFTTALNADEAQTSAVLLLGTLDGSETIRAYKEKERIELEETQEALTVKRLQHNDKDLLVVAGSDDTGLMYALLEISDQIRLSSDAEGWFDRVKDVSESPHVPVRSMSILLHNEDCEKDWYYSKEHWEEYFAWLASGRWNAFNLVFSHQTPYLSPLYAYHIKVNEHPEVKARGLTEEQRKKNLETLRFISSLAKARGVEFKLGIWQQIAWEGKHQAGRQESMVTGLTRKNMYSYTYHALLNLLKECPDIDAIQLRINHESGIDYDEQTEFFSNSVFKAIKDCGRPILLENRNVGLLRETLKASLDMGIPTRVSHKYWGEHMVFPYHPTRIMWTYSYGDWLKYPQAWQNLYHVWSLGSHRLLLWGDPDYVRRFAPTTLFQDADGFEICAPLSQKGMGNAPGAWRIFKDKDREYYRWEFERYWSWYTLFGRLTYNPGESDEVWHREMRARFGEDAVEPVSRAYKAASRVLTLIQGTATPDYNMYTWVEKDSGGLINFYLHYFSYEQLRIAGFMDHIDRTLAGKTSAKKTPEEMALRLEAAAEECESALSRADSLIETSNKEFWATKKDFVILSGMARFFAQKIRATVKMGFFYKTSDLSLLQEAIGHTRKALEIWKELSAEAEEIYYPDLIMGPGSYGHWKDNIVFIEDDLKQLLHQEELFGMVRNFDFGYDFGPKAYTDPTEIYTPWYTNYYSIEHRFQGVFPNSFFNPQQGFGWNNDVALEAEQPPKVGRTVWRASNLEDLDFPSQALLSDFVQGTEPAIFRLDLPEGHYQATLIFTDKTKNPRDHGPMSVSVVERFGERPILTDRVIKKGETVVEKFNFNMTGSRYSNFRLKFSAAPEADFIINGLTFTRIEPHIAHLPSTRALPGQDLELSATVSLPPQVLQHVKNSLSIARGTTSTIEPPDRITDVKFFYSLDGGKTFSTQPMESSINMVYTARIDGADVKAGEIKYYLQASDSIGQTVRLPRDTSDGSFSILVSPDRTPPVVQHTAPAECSPGEPVTIKARVTDETVVDRVLLYYRQTRQAMQYSVVQMEKTNGDEFTTVIPGNINTTEFDLMYFFEAVDTIGNGIFYPDQEVEDPHIIVRVRR